MLWHTDLSNQADYIHLTAVARTASSGCAGSIAGRIIACTGGCAVSILRRPVPASTGCRALSVPSLPIPGRGIAGSQTQISSYQVAQGATRWHKEALCQRVYLQTELSTQQCR